MARLYDPQTSEGPPGYPGRIDDFIALYRISTGLSFPAKVAALKRIVSDPMAVFLSGTNGSNEIEKRRIVARALFESNGTGGKVSKEFLESLETEDGRNARIIEILTKERKPRALSAFAIRKRVRYWIATQCREEPEKISEYEESAPEFFDAHAFARLLEKWSAEEGPCLVLERKTNGAKKITYFPREKKE